MSSFIELFGFDDEGSHDAHDAVEHRRPPWIGAPDEELGVALPIHRVIAASKTGVVGLSHGLVYSNGLTLEVRAIANGLGRSQTQRLFHEQHVFDSEEPSDAFLRIGVELPGGKRVSNLGGLHGHRRAYDADNAPTEPVLVPHGGGGGSSDGRRLVMRPAFWLWPLPKPGVMTVSCEWPVVGIPLTSVEIDTSRFGDLARSAIALGPQDAS